MNLKVFMDQSFAGKTIALTGGASGIGLSTTIALSLRGATVYVADIAASPPAELATLSNVHFTGNCDVTDRQSCKKFIESIPGRLDGLVNCAGICPNEGKMASDDLFAKIMAINVTGSWYMGTEAIQRMVKQEGSTGPGVIPGSERSLPAGVVVNFASGAALRGIANLAAYCTSKHAVLGMTRSWARDWPQLRINAVAPGVTNTPMARGGVDSGANKEDQLKLAAQLSSRIPLGRMAHPTDITDAVLFLLSEQSSFITGQVIPVNGGSD